MRFQIAQMFRPVVAALMVTLVHLGSLGSLVGRQVGPLVLVQIARILSAEVTALMVTLVHLGILGVPGFLRSLVSRQVSPPVLFQIARMVRAVVAALVATLHLGFPELLVGWQMGLFVRFQVTRVVGVVSRAYCCHFFL